MLSGTPTAVEEIIEGPIYTTINGSIISDFVFLNPVKNKICFAKPSMVKHYKLHTLAGQLIQAEKYSGK